MSFLQDSDFDLIDSDNVQQFCGWAGEELAAEEFDLIKDKFVEFRIVGASPFKAERRMMLYDVVRKVLGKDTPNYPQQIGDCVSFGAKNAIEYLQCCEILINGDNERFRPIYPPYLYGTGRVFVGRGQLDRSGDGSLGSWMAKAVIDYGAIASDENNLPQYSGSVAKKWGNSPGPPKEFVDIGKQHLVKSAAQIRSWDDLVQAICNGYPCTVASNQGFTMRADSNGFHNPEGNWGHQMCIIGVDDEYSDPYAIILNSWGDSHGVLKDFKTGENLPVGCIRARKRVIESMIRAGETFAYSNFVGFPGQNDIIDARLFDLIS
jgi:hypothetical protein